MFKSCQESDLKIDKSLLHQYLLYNLLQFTYEMQ